MTPRYPSFVAACLLLAGIAAEAADLEPFTEAGWSRPLVPREADDAQPFYVQDPVLLEGGTSTTWWNLAGYNNGIGYLGGFRCGIYVDGEYWSYQDFPAPAGGHVFTVINDGPLPVPGGRHTFEVFYDNLDQINETDETDNHWAHQWIWSPQLLTLNQLYALPAPPDPTAGWDAVVDGQTRYYNCDGVRFATVIYTGGSKSWDAVCTFAADDADNYNCRLHEHSTGASDGFAANIGYSQRAAGYLDAVIVNGNTAGFGNWDVGLLNGNDGTSACRTQRLRAATLTPEDSVTVALGTNEMMKLYRLELTAADTGSYRVKVTIDPPTQRVYTQWHEPSFETGSLNQYAARAESVAGVCVLDRQLDDLGWYGLVVYRDPVDGTGPCAVTVEIDRTPPDFVPHQLPGWHAPLVPRPQHDGTPTIVALPDTLHGNVAATYFNHCVYNASPGYWELDGGHYMISAVFLDGAQHNGVGWGQFLPFSFHTANPDYASTIRGGRHTLVMNLDPSNYYEELSETNNVFGEQYCWSPLLLAFDSPVTRTRPPDPTGGWDHLPVGQPIYANCDGLRLPAAAATHWRAGAVTPGSASDVDLQLFAPLVGTKLGFGEPLAESTWGPGASDFVVVSNSSSPFDLGVTRIAGTQDYIAEAVEAASEIPASSGTYGPFTLAAGHLLELRDVVFTPGTWTIRLVSLTGTVDWGLSIYSPGATYRPKSDTLPGGMSYLAAGGMDESITVQTTMTRPHTLAIWKASAADVPLAGTYELRIGTGTTATPDSPPLPTVTAIAGVSPNPFNPRTTIRFDLAAPGQVRLAVYDARGQRLRTLVDASLPAGRHEAIWDGVDDQERAMASGVYLVRLDAGGTQHLRKMLLTK